MGRLPSLPMAISASRITLSASHSTTTSSLPSRLNIQVRHATFIERPRRPYTFTQLVTLSDGSTYTMRTTSPASVYRSTKDSRNTLLWQPTDRSLRNVELDEAGKLAAFRERFGRAFDASKILGQMEGEEQGEEQEQKQKASPVPAEDESAEDDFTDLITAYATEVTTSEETNIPAAAPKKAPKRKK
ncbi:hypothetical protein E4U31_000987 [Claviceps sp. LM219 group G6]|nr:hypothetical protein E4U15_002107 [Claviceps sp. LM218 group G6]KAG6106196.1 hypothetical protein E4U31_000987 [Claviceps sp. LM219 group G6]KAG6120357.1 hypothetical protein E4U14_003622 [Claviceps sp. LM454 group G7]